MELLGVSGALMATPRWLEGPQIWYEDGRETLRGCWRIIDDQAEFLFDPHIFDGTFRFSVRIKRVKMGLGPRIQFIDDASGMACTVLILRGPELWRPRDAGYFGPLDQINYGVGPVSLERAA